MSILTETIGDMLVKQYEHEISNSLKYATLEVKFANLGFTNIEKFFSKQANDERSHADMIIKYLKDKDHDLKMINPCNTFNVSDDFENNFKISLELERETTRLIKNIAKVAFEISDLETFFFLSSLIKEQTEEEALFSTILDRIECMKDYNYKHDLDQWIGSL